MSAEPSMEEILSSIKRIIAEEGDGPVRSRRAPRAAPPVAQPAPAPAGWDDDDDREILELSDPIAPAAPAMIAAAPDVPAATSLPHPSLSPSSVEDTEIVPEPVALRHAAPAPSASAPAAGSSATQSSAGEPLLSSHTADASRSALDSLTRIVSRPSGGEAADDNSLEGMVRAMLRPMLREWLDTHLPPMVEQMVAGEIARITGQRP